MSLTERRQIELLHQLLDIGIALTAEKRYESLLEMIVVRAKELTHADGGTLYTVTSDNKLKFEIIRSSSFDLSKGEMAKHVSAGIPIYDETGKPNDQLASVYAYTHKCAVNIEDVYQTDRFDFSGPREFDKKAGYHSKSILTVPLLNREQQVVGILQLLNAKDDATGESIAFSADDQYLVEYLASVAAVAISNQRLVYEMQQTFNALQEVLNVGVALSAESDHTRLLEMILESAKDLTHADGGTLYTMTKEKKLHFEIVRNDSLNLRWGGENALGTSQHIAFHDIPLYDSQGIPNNKMIAVYAVLNNCTVNIPDAYQTDHFDFSGTREFDKRSGYHSQSFLTVPLKNHEEETIGVLQLLNARDKKTGKLKSFSKEDQLMVESFASQAAIAMSNESLITELRVLFESLINMLADAIDEKSPITGRHCRRVPIIADLLAKAVNAEDDGPFKDASFNSNELYELNIAALLHDCGKVVTPVHVVEKSKKLETIIDRIQLLDARLEILRRDVMIKSLQEKIRILTEGELGPIAKHQQAFAAIEEKEKQQLDELMNSGELLHRSNRGMEEMPLDWQEKIKALSRLTWENSQQIAQPFLNEDEIKNLLIPRGTLTDEERKVIQNHVVMTMRMLKGIPYPKYLREVPEIAGKHHERIDGKGYPLGLTGDQMSVRARILAIADVFEALTAPDRPYKDCMPLSVALRILGKMKEEGHIDPDLFDVFLKQKVYLTYAKKYLQPDQIDVE